MLKVYDVTGAAGGESFLVVSMKSAILVDAGFIFSAEAMVDKIAKILGKRNLDYILLTHSHYDHAGGIGVLREAYPSAKVVGSAHTAKTFRSDHALAGMVDLDINAAMIHGQSDYTGANVTKYIKGMNTEPNTSTFLSDNGKFLHIFHVDEPVSEGDIINAADLTIHVYDTPGHTRGDSSYYFEEDRLLVAAETLGVFISEDFLVPALIVSYEKTIESIEKLSSLNPTRVIIPHFGLIEGRTVDLYFKKAYEAADEAVRILKAGIKDGKTKQEILEDYKNAYYPGAKAESVVMQPEEAFLINFNALIPRIAEELDLTIPQ
ncbi:MAG: MBL fold metallo-hydrolase [Clostridiales Family XIII bacterium]|jgi:glyoxylase-like metal-dependent hydrolase (beta-lactamase superfamily II)|nr:MBL fold metallo-hydrolase [Clostridiales Family XIII bacterium]